MLNHVPEPATFYQLKLLSNHGAGEYQFSRVQFLRANAVNAPSEQEPQYVPQSEAVIVQQPPLITNAEAGPMGPTYSLASSLKDLQQAMSDGLITEEEHATAKSKLLSSFVNMSSK